MLNQQIHFKSIIDLKYFAVYDETMKKYSILILEIVI